MAKLAHQSLDCAHDRDQDGQTNNETRERPDTVDDRVPLSTINLFGKFREVEIEHRGRRYCLRITRKNGLILNALD